MFGPADLETYNRYRIRAMERLLANTPPDARWDEDRPDILELLHSASVATCELIPTGSNDTYLVTVDHREAGSGLAVYKPRSGEAPLMDFPFGTLYRREIAAYELSRLLGWGVVPPTVGYEGPRGVGSLQLFIDAALEENFFTLRDRIPDQLRRMALFDCLTNNADRKGGHCLMTRDGRLRGIDHGLTFHAQWKLRTVIWDFAREPFPQALLADLVRLQSRLRDTPDDFAALFALIDPDEQRAFEARLAQLIEHGCFPSPGPYRSVPWPPL